MQIRRYFRRLRPLTGTPALLESRRVENYGKRIALKSYHIYKNTNNVNLQLESGFIDNIYIPII